MGYRENRRSDRNLLRVLEKCGDWQTDLKGHYCVDGKTHLVDGNGCLGILMEVETGVGACLHRGKLEVMQRE